MAYDQAHQNVILFGGQTDSNPTPPTGCPTGVTDDTWMWDGSWHPLNPASRPPARASEGLAWDAISQRVILFGGWGKCNPSDPQHSYNCDDTWSWDGTTWFQCNPCPGPPARSSPAMDFHVERNRVILFGGDGDTGFLNDTWQWNGSAWSPVTNVGTPPSPRVGQRMVYDPHDQDVGKHAVLLFGGCTSGCMHIDDPGTGVVGDTWTLDGGKWKERTPPASPAARCCGAMVYFGPTTLNRVVLFGGASPTLAYADTWLWDGVHWTCILQNCPP